MTPADAITAVAVSFPDKVTGELTVTEWYRENVYGDSVAIVRDTVSGRTFRVIGDAESASVFMRADVN